MLYLKYILLNTSQPPKVKIVNPSRQKMYVNFTKISVHSLEKKILYLLLHSLRAIINQYQLLASEDDI
jgi:hypothetical protein